MNIFHLGSIALFFLTPLSEATFIDVPESYEYYNAIKHLENDEIVQGYSIGIFEPDRKISRSEFTKIVVETMKRQTHGAPWLINEEKCLSNIQNGWIGPGSPFPDVDYESWHGPYVCQAHHHSILFGNPDGTFRPADSINAVEAIRIIIRSFEADLPESHGATEDARAAAEEPGAPWYAYDLYKASSYDLIPPSIQLQIEKGKFDYSISRGEMAELIYRVRTWPYIWPYNENFSPLSLAEARDVRRSRDLNRILYALRQYALDHKGEFPVELPQQPMEICTQESENCNGFVDLTGLLEKYVLHIPKDPLTGTDRNSRYMIRILSGNILELSAPDGETKEILYAD